jgi:tetratricopeptide (TPR) repeat protein
MGYSYRQLGIYDSAAYIFDQGLKYVQEDIELLEYAGENAGKLNKVEKQIYYYDKILSIKENNPEILKLLSNIYRDQAMFEEQIDVLNIWLKYEPASKNANAEKKAAFSALGKDESDVDRERWESETSNIQYGLDYIRSLDDAGNSEKVVDVCNELLVYEKYNTIVLQSLGDAYQNLYKEDEALNIYQDLAKVDPTDYNVAIEISKILINKEEFKEALNWAEKAVSISGKHGETIYQRAEVYFAVAEYCSGDPLTFWDKVVYEISWEDYKTASNKGYSQAKSRRIFIEDNFITTSSDWFMRSEGEQEVTPQGECYLWIEKSIKRK